MKKIFQIRYLIYLVVILCVFMVSWSAFRLDINLETVSNTRPQTLEEWKIVFQDGSSRTVELPVSVRAEGEEHVILRKAIDEELCGQTIAFRTVNQNVIVRLDKEQLYKYEQTAKNKFVDSPGNIWNFITLPNEIKDGELEVEFYSPYSNVGGTITPIIWGARSACILNFMYSEWPNLLIGFALFIIGIVFMLLYYTLGHLKLKNYGIFYLGFATVLLAFNMIVMSGMLQIFYGNAIFYYLIRYITMYFLMIPFLVFLARTVLHRYQEILSKISFIYILVFFFILILQWTGVVDLAYFGGAIWGINIVILSTVLILAVMTFLHKEAGLTHGMLGLMCVLEIGFVICDYFRDKLQQVSLRHYGFVIMFLFIGSYYIVQVVRQYRVELETRMQKNTERLSGLHYEYEELQQQRQDDLEAKKKAEELNNIKSIFLGNVAGKLLMPMNRIIGLNELILRDEINDNVKEKASNIQSEGSVLITLINNILDYSKVENNQLEIKSVAYHMDNLLYDMCEQVSVGIIDKKIDFIVDFSPSMPRELLGDEIRLRQILTNILNNAIKYTEEGIIRFRVDSTLTDADEVLLNIVISDTGIGIAQENMDQLFENFLMNDPAIVSEHQGAGLGLAICKRLIDMMGGTIDVESQLGEGTVFNLVIPQKIINGLPIVETDSRQFKVLIYETNQLQRMILKKTCMDLQLEADFVMDENEFTGKIATKVYHTVLICEEQYIKHQEYLNSDVCSSIRKVVLLDVASSMNSFENADLLQRPIHCMNLYDAISGNDIIEPIVVDSVQTFIAPQAELLIVDDNPSNLKIMIGMMEPYKMQLTTAISGSECLELLDQDKTFDLIFMDYTMPEKSGVQTLHQIREKSEKYYKTLPIVAMTSQRINGAKELFLSEGFDNYIDKPFEIGHLEKILEEFLPADLIIRSENGEPEEG